MRGWCILFACGPRAEDQLGRARREHPRPPWSAAGEHHFLIANDQDLTLAPVQEQLALPQETCTTRARTLLNDLFAEYAQPGSPRVPFSSSGERRVPVAG